MTAAPTVAGTPDPPYFAVIFTSVKRDDDGYGEVSRRMYELASSMPGFLGVESARGEDGMGITVSYWSSLESIADWKRDLEHLEAQQLGRELSSRRASATRPTVTTTRFSR